MLFSWLRLIRIYLWIILEEGRTPDKTKATVSQRKTKKEEKQRERKKRKRRSSARWTRFKICPQTLWFSPPFKIWTQFPSTWVPCHQAAGGEAETVKNWGLLPTSMWASHPDGGYCRVSVWKDPDAGRDWGQEEKGMTEDEMTGWHHLLDGMGLSKLRELVMDREA